MFQNGEINRNRLPRCQFPDDLLRFSLLEAKFQLTCKYGVELLQDLEAQPARAVTYKKCDPIVSAKLLLRFRVVVQLDEDVSVNEDRPNHVTRPSLAVARLPTPAFGASSP